VKLQSTGDQDSNRREEERTAGLDITWFGLGSPTGFDILPSDNPICAQSQDTTIQLEQLDSIALTICI